MKGGTINFMVSTILGLSAGLVGFIILLIGVLSMFKGSLGQTAKGILSAIPLGNVKLWGIIFIIGGLVLGGLPWGISGVQSLWHSGASASLVQDEQVSPTVGQAVLQNCEITAITATTAAATGNITFRSDPNDNAHYYIDLKNSTTSAGGASINGTILCSRETNNIRDGQYVNCYVKSSTFKNADSTTDSNTYYTLATSNAKSFVPGFPWRQTAYLNDGAIATTSSSVEQTKYTFAQDTTSRTLGFYFTLASSTNLGYLTDQSSVDVDIYCGNDKTAYFTVTKLTE